jgi:pimeloyl-ACP methyl ester carboxylesterase
MAPEPTPTDAPTGGRPKLLAIHGLGATSGVWAGLREEMGDAWDVVAPDLPGHGGAPWSGDYTVGALAAAVSGACSNGEPVVAVGHSLGGAVALALASGFFRPVVSAVVAVGVKVVWTDEDVAGMAKVAGRGVRWYESREEAVGRAIRLGGLDGLVGPDHPAAVTAVAQEGGRWRVAQDPATFAQRPLAMADLMAAARCPVVLAAGAGDAMVTEADLAVHTDRPRIAAGRGHNVHVEDPAWVAGLIAEATAAGAAH